ncbi:Uncharacterised protein [Mycobacteroides abscessus subsp. abscessus]|uniref:Uncharacterized protein n=2 Tax=Mycobacteroides abscessus TaxID=36809 RepID=A0AB33T5D2_9MYCO|nr:hypothetical protein [Mycobacteroides abscessus]EIC66639.1 hypothetical protein S7W_15300 [Mycobacteroides abscessus M94]EUA45474.1 hypothetical protein I543_4123 [Mycobacteroides abscessus 21]MBE5442020.1 hypothetical protein [Mycobacteroides abscessus]MBE5449332.1 hypothetical protein [Mycobacteroides abscessus]MBE5463666.1 hypothetical protein [Mycobacteroides abscessus]
MPDREKTLLRHHVAAGAKGGSGSVVPVADAHAGQFAGTCILVAVQQNRVVILATNTARSCGELVLCPVLPGGIDFMRGSTSIPAADVRSGPVVIASAMTPRRGRISMATAGIVRLIAEHTCPCVLRVPLRGARRRPCRAGWGTRISNL